MNRGTISGQSYLIGSFQSSVFICSENEQRQLFGIRVVNCAVVFQQNVGNWWRPLIGWMQGTKKRYFCIWTSCQDLRQDIKTLEPWKWPKSWTEDAASKQRRFWLKRRRFETKRHYDSSIKNLPFLSLFAYTISIHVLVDICWSTRAVNTGQKDTLTHCIRKVCLIKYSIKLVHWI